MIVIYRTQDDPVGADIVDHLRERVVAFEDVTVAPDASLPHPLPAVAEGGKVVAAGPDEVSAFLAELDRFLTEWSRFQSDACYLDEDGRVC